MKRLIIATLLSISFFQCTVNKLPSEKCEEFKSGKYIYNIYNESGLGHWKKLTFIIIRKDSLELVTSTHFPKDTAIYRITWTGNCEYKSLRLNPQIDLDSFLVRQNPTGTDHKIVKATEDYFIIKNFGRIDTIWKAR